MQQTDQDTLHSDTGSTITQPWSLAGLTLPHRLIQGPLAGYSCAPFRELFTLFQAPAYAVSEMLSANDVLHKHTLQDRYLYRSPNEKLLCYQIAGTKPDIMASAAQKLESIGADLIDINCGCPKPKIRTKGAGSALRDTPGLLLDVVKAVRRAIRCPLTVKIRLTETAIDRQMAQCLALEGVDALIVHGRRWHDDYGIPCDLAAIRAIKEGVSIPVIANGDVDSIASLQHALDTTACDAIMIARAGTGKPWLFQGLLENKMPVIAHQGALFLQHLRALATLQGEFPTVLQSRSLCKYYLNKQQGADFFQNFLQLSSLPAIEAAIVNAYGTSNATF